MKTQEIHYPLTNADFLKAVSNSFKEFLDCETSRSTAKLKPLHGAIATDIAIQLDQEYSVLSQGYKTDKEGSVQGRYIDKKVDITIYKNNKPIAGIAVKFVMQNYAQNSNNYFENMLGETANIRSNGIPYFQIFIILDKLPYYKKSNTIDKWETFTEHHICKYTALSQDDIDKFQHTPNKTLIYVVHIPDCGSLTTKAEYMDFYRNCDFSINISDNKYPAFGQSVILNDYQTFISKVYHAIMAL